jgi:hypothetical protein
MGIANPGLIRGSGRHGPMTSNSRSGSKIRNSSRIVVYESPRALEDVFKVIEIEVQNETHQTQERVRFAVVPRLGEGIRLREPDGFWASYDVIDVWYQKADYGDIWVPYIHIRITGAEQVAVSELDAVISEKDLIPFTV